MTGCRRATLPELEQILDWAAAEGWNPGLDDAEAFFAADPQGFFVATDPTNRLVGAISVINHSPDFAFLGLYIVRPEFRGQGIGLGLWRHALEHAGPRTVGLDGVEEQQDNYRISGFVHAGGTTRFIGDLGGQPDPAIRLATPQDVPSLIRMEATASGQKKPTYLRAWFSHTATRATLVLTQGGAVTGGCTIRACRTGAKIGPLVAANAVDATRLIRHATTLFDGPVTLDVPETSGDLHQFCQNLGLAPGFKTARMYRGTFDRPKSSIYAVTSLELG